MKKKLIILFSLVIILIIDRLAFMPQRVRATWEFESGCYFGDPIAYTQDFELKGAKIVFNLETKQNLSYNRKKTPYLIGCYLGQMILYDFKEKKLTRYVRY